MREMNPINSIFETHNYSIRNKKKIIVMNAQVFYFNFKLCINLFLFALNNNLFKQRIDIIFNIFDFKIYFFK